MAVPKPKLTEFGIHYILESCGQSRKKHVLISYHRHVNVAGVKFHVDLFVDQSLRLGVEVGPDLGDGHFGILFLSGKGAKLAQITPSLPT